MRFLRVLLLLLLFMGASTAFAMDHDALVEGFQNPPAAARPWVYWFIMDGNLSRAGITADLEAMSAAGIGGAIIMEVNVGIPRGDVEFMSDRWCALFKHAVQEAERLGLQITLNAGPGWTGSGGPWVPVEQSMQHLVASSVAVTGPSRFAGKLPQPKPREPYFGSSGLPAWLLQAREAFYADVAVLAVPATDARLADVNEKALYVRDPYSSMPGVKAYLPTRAAYPVDPPATVIASRAVVDLTDRLQSDGRIEWDVPAGAWTILRFGRRTTGANTRPAPRPGLGFECDKFDSEALDAHYDAFVGKLLKTIGQRPVDRTTGWTMLHIDSWEMGAQNWTAHFRQQFQQRRGYDPLPYLPVMTGRIVESGEISERFLWDLRLTCQELVIENYASRLRELGHRDGFGLSIEPYDMNPSADMSLGGIADVPMCEFWSQGYGFDTRFSCFEATSIAHTRGRPIVAAEAFTATDSRGLEAIPGSDEKPGRLGVLHRHQSICLSSLCTSAVVGSSSGHDDGTVRSALGAHADLVATGLGLPPIPGPLPVPAATGTHGGRRLLPGSRRCTTRVSPTTVRTKGNVGRSAGIQFRWLHCRDAPGRCPSWGSPGAAAERRELSPAGAPCMHDDDAAIAAQSQTARGIGSYGRRSSAAQIT